MLRLHGVPLSQPFRSVAWTLLQKRVPFEVSLCVPGSGGKRGSKGEAYLALNPLGTVPLLEDGPIKVVESAAILQYLSSKHGWTDLYPASLSDRARVDAFCHWHHGGTRQLAGGFYAPHVRPDMAEKFGEDGIARAKKNGLDALDKLETIWLAADPFLAAANATLADLIAYEEVAQLAFHFGLYDDSGDGVMDMKELEAAMLSLGHTLDRKELKHMLSLIDTDRSFTVDFGEFAQLLKRMVDGVLQVDANLTQQSFVGSIGVERIKAEVDAMVADACSAGQMRNSARQGGRQHGAAH